MGDININGNVQGSQIGGHHNVNNVNSTPSRPTRDATPRPIQPEPDDDGKDYDLAFSFARGSRDYVEGTKVACDRLGLRVMYDRDRSNKWWGKNYLVEQRKIYGKRALFFVPFISADYFSRPIPYDEFMTAMWADAERGGGYILPVFLGDVRVPSHLLHKQIGYLNADEYTEEELAAELRQKVDEAKHDSRRQHKDIGDILGDAAQQRAD